MKKLLLILMLLVGVNNSYGQHYFNKVDAVHSFEGYFTSVIERNGKFYCTGTSVDSINDNNDGTYTYASGIRFTVFDNIGNKIRDTFYQHPIRLTNSYYNNMVLLPSGEFMVGVQSMLDDVNLEVYSWLMRFDSLGNLISHTEFSKPFCTANQNWALNDVKPTGTGEWLILGEVRCGGQSDPFLIKLDSNFNTIWSKQFSITYTNRSNKLHILDDGYLIGSGRTNFGLQGNNFVSTAMVILTDTSGTQQWWWWSDADSLISGAADIKETQDGGYIYVGGGGGVEVDINGSSADLQFRCWIEKIDPMGNVIWNKYLSPFSGSPSTIIELEDASLIVGGTVYSGFNDADTTNKIFAFLKKLSPSGNTIWERLYSPPYSTVYPPHINDVKRTSDGGFVLVGDSWYTPWILKVDSNGCEQGAGVCNPTDVAAIENNTAAKIKAYPNPAGNVLYIEGAEDKAAYRLVSITGTVLLKGTFHIGINQLNLQDVPSGMYILHTGAEVIKMVKE